MNNRLAAYALDSFDSYDQNVLIELVLAEKAEPSSIASSDLSAYLNSQLPIESKFASLTEYMALESNWGRNFHTIISRAITQMTKSKANPATHINVTRTTGEIPKLHHHTESWLLTDVMLLDERIKWDIISSFSIQIRWGFCQSSNQSVYSKILQKAMLDNSLSNESKWEAILDFCKQKHNAKRTTYFYLMKSMVKVVDQALADLVAAKQFPAAFDFLQKFNKKLAAANFIRATLLNDSFQADYLKLYDLSKKANLKDFYKEELVRKISRDIQNTPRSTPSVLRVPFQRYEALARIPSAFFSQQRRHFVPASQLRIIFKNLSLLSSLLNSEGKATLLNGIAAIYQDKIKLSQSYSSKSLIKAIAEKPAAEAWEALVDYMISDHGLVLTNNGSRLFHIIKNETQATIDGIFNEARPERSSP